MTKSIKTQLTDLFQSAIQATYGLQVDPVIQLAGKPEFGDYQANFAMRLTKELKQPPIEIAKKVIAHLAESPIFEKLETAGPGFINITLKNDFLTTHLQTIAQNNRLGINTANPTETIVIDYGGANVAKEMHIGHLRSAIIGDALVRILDFLGHKVIKQNHLGDWGTQFGMLIEFLLEKKWDIHASHQYSDLNTLYKQAKIYFDENTDFAERARARVVALQSSDKMSADIWQQLVNESKHHFQIVYDKLNVLLTEQDACGESFYNDMLEPMTQALEKSNIATIDDGALVIFLEGFVDPDNKPLPLLIRKKDGGYLYATTDLAAIKYRIQTLQASRILYVVDARQRQHFAMVFAAAEKAHWTNEKISLEHIAYGAVLGEDHKPFKTRSGESIKLIDVLNEAETRAAAIIKQKHPDLSASELSHIAQCVGIGALKYADLRNDKVKDYVFSWDKMLAFDGNTGPYVQNAYVRICSLFRKAEIPLDSLQDRELSFSDPLEHMLAIKISTLPDIIFAIADNLHIHILCDYLYDLAATFHRFYEHCPILNQSDQKIKATRLFLSQLTARTLALGLKLLGINTLDKM